MITKPVFEFVESFCEQLKLLLTHFFIAKQQSLFQMEDKSYLQPGVFQVMADSLKTILLYSKMKHRGFTGITRKQLYILLLYITQNQVNYIS